MKKSDGRKLKILTGPGGKLRKKQADKAKKDIKRCGMAAT